jgi:hypothetical protein
MSQDCNIVQWPAKAPAAALDYALDLTSWLAQAPGDPLLRVDVVSVAPAGLTVLQPPDISPTPHVVLWLGGGVHDTVYEVVLQPWTAASRTDVFVALIAVRDPIADAAGRIGAGMAAR